MNLSFLGSFFCTGSQITGKLCGYASRDSNEFGCTTIITYSFGRSTEI